MSSAVTVVSSPPRVGEKLAGTVSALPQGLIDRERFDTSTGAGETEVGPDIRSTILWLPVSVAGR